MASENDIDIRTNSGEYVGGDTVYGVVYLKLTKPVQSRTLKLTIKGYEQTEYGYSFVMPTGNDTYEARNGKRTGLNVFPMEDLRMIEYPGGFPIGLSSFPFQYQLPHGLPGVCSIKNGEFSLDESHYEGTIGYSIGAALVNPSPRPKLQVSIPLVIYDNFDCRNSYNTPDKRTASGIVRTFFCLNRGKIIASTKLDRSSYSNNEEIKLSLEIINESSVDVLGATVTLKRVLKLLGKDDSDSDDTLIDHTSLETVLMKEHGGCGHGNSIAWNECLKLLEREETILIPPTTTGKLVKCIYFIDMEVHCPWAPVIEIQQPLIIKPPANSTWKAWSIPDWINQCTVGSVTHPLSVSRDMLYSELFDGVPGVRNNV